MDTRWNSGFIASEMEKVISIIILIAIIVGLCLLHPNHEVIQKEEVNDSEENVIMFVGKKILSMILHVLSFFCKLYFGY
jgi:hypothetical protein